MHRLRAALPLLAALALSAGLAAMALGPAAQTPGEWLVCNWTHPDCLSNHWALEWVASALLSGESILHNGHYYWPIGDAPVLAGHGVEGIAYLPFHLLWGWPAAAVAYIGATLTLNGLGGYALGRAAGAGRWESLLSAAVTGLMPYTIREASSGRFTQSSLFWLLFFLAAWGGFLAKPGKGRALLAATLLALTSFFYWYYGLFGVMAGGVWLAVRGLRGGRAALPGAGLLALFSAAFLALIGPWGYAFLAYWQDLPGTSELAAFPHPEAVRDASTPAWPFLVRSGRAIGRAMAGSAWGLGLVGAGLALWPRGDRSAPWRGPSAAGLVAVWVLFEALAMGPLFDHAPYTLLYGLADPLRRFWWPNRHIGVAQAALGALAALALTALAARIRWRGAAPVLGLAAALSCPLLLRAQGPPVDLTLTHLTLPPEGYVQLGELPDGVLVEPPVSPGASGGQNQLIYQFFHKKPLLTGHAMWVDRMRPDAWDDFVASHSFLSALQALERGELGGEFTFDGADLTALRDQGLRWFSLDREAFPATLPQLYRTYNGLFSALFGEPVIRAPGVRIWDAEGWTGQDSVAIEPFRWPPGVQPGGPDQPLSGRRPRSTMFSTATRGGAASDESENGGPPGPPPAPRPR